MISIITVWSKGNDQLKRVFGKYIVDKISFKELKQYCDGKVVSILEGGYDLQALQESTELHVKALIEFNW